MSNTKNMKNTLDTLNRMFYKAISTTLEGRIFKMSLEKDIQELTVAVRELVKVMSPKTPARAAEPKPKAEEVIRKVIYRETDVNGELIEEIVEAKPTPVITYGEVKSAVLSVVKALGREGSLNLLDKFGVVSGKGNDRKGDMNKIKPEDYPAVIEAAKKALAS